MDEVDLAVAGHSDEFIVRIAIDIAHSERLDAVAQGRTAWGCGQKMAPFDFPIALPPDIDAGFGKICNHRRRGEQCGGIDQIANRALGPPMRSRPRAREDELGGIAYGRGGETAVAGIRHFKRRAGDAPSDR